MSTELLFWLFMLAWLIFGVFMSWPRDPSGPRGGWQFVGGNLFIFILFLILGWKVFGAPLHG